jgi:hypothetical protein
VPQDALQRTLLALSYAAARVDAEELVRANGRIQASYAAARVAGPLCAGGLLAVLPDFRRDYAKLTEAQKKAFRVAVKKFVIDLRRSAFRGSLRVKPMQDNPNIFEMTWAGQGGRATFDYGPEQRPGEKHVRWRRIGGHDIFDRP